MPEGEKKTTARVAEGSSGIKESVFKSAFSKLRKRRIIETLVAFVGGGWLLVEIVDRLLVSRYKFPEETIDLTVVSVIAALLATLIWRWFGGTEKRPGNIKVEVLLVPLIILTTLAIDLIIVQEIIGIHGKTLIIAAVAVCMGIGWIILKSLQWAAAPAMSSENVHATAGSSIPVPAVPDKSIVVLPFTNISPEEGQEYFCDGMTEEIIADLSRVHELLVISRSSAMTFKSTKKTIPEIARAVNVRYAMEGSVRKAGNDLRITAQLIDALTDTHVWAEKYSGTLDDVFKIQEQVSRSIVEALKLRLTPEEKRRIAENPIPNVYAYECFIKARQEIWKWTEDGLGNALMHLQKGLDIVGENAVLLAGMGYVHYQYLNTGYRTDELTRQKAEEYTKHALELDPESPIAHVVLGLMLPGKGEYREGIAHLKRALAVEPNNFDALVWLACTLSFLGKPIAASAFGERLSKTEPLHPMTRYALGFNYYLRGDFEISAKVFGQAVMDFPQDCLIRWNYAQVLAYCRRVEEGYSVIKALVDEAPQDPLARVGFAFALTFQDRKQESLLILRDPKITAWASSDLGISFFVGECYALLGRKAEALDWLSNAVERGFINYPFLAEKDPFLASVRGEPRFEKLLERVKDEWEHFEV